MASEALIGYRGVLLTLLLVYQFYVSVRVARSTYYSQRQKAIQFLLIWVIPLAAALMCHIVLASTRRSPRGGDPNFVRDDNVNPPGIGQ